MQKLLLPGSRLANFGMDSLGKGLTGLAALGVMLRWCKGPSGWLGPGDEGRWLQVQGTHWLLAPFWGASQAGDIIHVTACCGR